MTHGAIRVCLVALIATAFACSARQEQVETGKHSIIGGSEAADGAWPGTVALYKGTLQWCGGTLIADQWVLTAGHCVDPSATDGGITKVVIGRTKLSTTTGDERTVDRAVRHEGFSEKDLDNDVALLHLSAPSTAPKAKLVTPEQRSKLVDGAGVTVVGWGSTSEGGGTSDVLRQVTIPVLPNTQCVTYEDYNIVTPNMICAGFVTGDFDSCQGDSGGPLFMKIDGQQVQVGSVSWGIGCARPNAPGVYARIGNYLGWLWEKTEGAAGAAPMQEDGGVAVDGGPGPGPGPTSDGGAP